jgi:probable rRNA maturation factor
MPLDLTLQFAEGLSKTLSAPKPMPVGLDDAPHASAPVLVLPHNPRSLLKRSQVQTWIQTVLTQTNPRLKAHFTVRVVGEEEGRKLNLQYRKKDHATNVLTFSYEQEPELKADLVLCAPVVAREAHSQGIALQSHYVHLIIHGTLHAQGYDHESEAQAHVMEFLETQIMLKLGFGDPYMPQQQKKADDTPGSDLSGLTQSGSN